MKRLILILLAAVGMMSCQTQHYIPQQNNKDSIRIVYSYDTIIQHVQDSSVTKVINDTVWLEKWHTQYKDKISIRHDTVVDTQHETVIEVQKIVPDFYKWCTLGFWIIIVLFIARILLKVFAKL